MKELFQTINVFLRENHDKFKMIFEEIEKIEGIFHNSTMKYNLEYQAYEYTHATIEHNILDDTAILLLHGVRQLRTGTANFVDRVDHIFHQLSFEDYEDLDDYLDRRQQEYVIEKLKRAGCQ